MEAADGCVGRPVKRLVILPGKEMLRKRNGTTRMIDKSIDHLRGNIETGLEIVYRSVCTFLLNSADE